MLLIFTFLIKLFIILIGQNKGGKRQVVAYIIMKNFKKIGAIFLASGLVLSGCSTKDANTSQGEKKEIKTISLDDFTKNLGSSEYQFVDTRSDEAYNGFKTDGIKWWSS